MSEPTLGDLVKVSEEVAVLRERKRIIELLETLKVGEACCADCQPHADRNRHYLTSVIALIKGENE